MYINTNRTYRKLCRFYEGNITRANFRQIWSNFNFQYVIRFTTRNFDHTAAAIFVLLTGSDSVDGSLVRGLPRRISIFRSGTVAALPTPSNCQHNVWLQRNESNSVTHPANGITPSSAFTQLATFATDQREIERWLGLTQLRRQCRRLLRERRRPDIIFRRSNGTGGVDTVNVFRFTKIPTIYGVF